MKKVLREATVTLKQGEELVCFSMSSPSEDGVEWHDSGDLVELHGENEILIFRMQDFISLYEWDKKE